MAKIDILTIGTEKIEDGAISAIIKTETPATNTLARRSNGSPPDTGGTYCEYTLVITNSSANPVQLLFAISVDFPGDGRYPSGGPNSTTVAASIRLRRTRDDKSFFFTGTIGPYDGQSHRTPDYSGQTIDMDAGTSETYAMTFKYFTSGPLNESYYPNVPTFIETSLIAIVSKR